jgi:hypothetical protein
LGVLLDRQLQVVVVGRLSDRRDPVDTLTVGAASSKLTSVTGPVPTSVFT